VSDTADPATATMQVWCIATSGTSSVASDCATLTPTAGPTILQTRAQPRASGTYYTLYADVPAEEAPDVTFEWYEGQIGDTRLLMGNSYYVNAYPSLRPAYFWVRVRNMHTNCFTDAQVVLP
jgi:hypothetical protein